MPQDDPNIPYIYQIYQLVDDISKYRDEEGRRAAILWSMSTTVQDLPFTLWSSQRRYLATIDVEDLPLDIRHTFSLDGRGSPDALSCSLFLFTDCLLIAKRPDVRSSGRQLVGLDDIDALVHASNQPDFTNINHSSSSGSNKLMSPGSPAKPRPQSPLKTLHHQRSASSFSLKKHSLKARGLVPLQHITATDLGAKGFVLHLAQPPSDSNWSKRWNDQSLRHYAVSLTSGAGNPAIEKNAFLDALWDAQARCSGKTFVTSSGAPPASPTKKPVSEVQSPPCTIYKSSVAQVREAAEWPISDAMRSSQEWNVYFAAWPADEYGASDGTKVRYRILKANVLADALARRIVWRSTLM